MPLTFLRRRSRIAREESIRALELSIQQLGKLVLNVTALADRLDARPPRDAAGAAQREQRVQVLREAAACGQQAIDRLTADLADRASPER